MATRTRSTAWIAGTLLCLGVALFSYRYPLQLGLVPDMIAANRYFNPWLAIHAAAGATALLLAPLQFLSALRRKSGVHRWIGRVYAVACLLGGLAGLLLATGASTGAVSTAGFSGLALGWLITTSIAWRHAWQGRFNQHRAWMIRSFALTFAAVTLRLYLLLVPVLPFAADDAYRAISFLCWVPNLLAAELYLRRRQPLQPAQPRQGFFG